MAKKRFGQNFLIDKNIARKILSFEKIAKQNILEIGPGNLALTKEIIIQQPKKYLGIEIDQSLIDEINNEELLSNIIHEDALKVDEIELFNKDNFTVISNLPFNISSQLLIKWCFLQNNFNCINSMTLMFQKELGERLISKINSKKFGKITIISNAFFNIKKVLLVSKNNFFPRPKVDAIVLKFDKLKKNKIKKEKFNKLQKITSFFFNERRKKNKKKFLKFFSKEQIMQHNLEKYFDLRAENLDQDLYYKLTDII